MKNFCMALTTLIFIFGLQTAALAAPDTFIGDAAIYSALDTGSTRPRPNVLFVIDNSQATLNVASGVKYDPTFSYTELGFGRWTVYAGDNQGTFQQLQIANTGIDPANPLENMSCAPVMTSLQSSGTYSGAGTASYPNLKTGGDKGACATGPTGSTYALGNYLNYLQANTVVSSEYKVTVPYTYTKKIQGQWQTFTEPREFQVTQAHVADATNKPGSGANWAQYWTLLAGVSTPAAADWVPAKSYSAPTTAGKTQREIIYDALKTVVGGARYAVNFGAMTYGSGVGNKGGKIVSAMKDLHADTDFNDFLAAIPGPKSTITLVWSGEKVVTSPTARPQSQALYDAGFYFDVNKPTLTYPGTQQSIAETTKIPDIIRNPCGYNHIIVITNGLSASDQGTAATLDAIGDYDGDNFNGGNEGVYGSNGGSHYLDDVAKYLKVNEGITTHSILAFMAADPLVEGAAERGGGKFYNVYDANAMAAALTKLLTSIVLEADTSFVAPVVPASSTNRTISSNRVYLGLFKPQNNRPWLGNLKKYGVSSSLALQDRNSTPTTDANGDFLPNSKSFWGDAIDPKDGVKKIMSINGFLPLVTGGVSGDGGNVAAGGVGGALILNLKAGLLETPRKEAWQSRNIYTWVTGTLPQTLSASTAHRFSPTNTNITATTLAVDAANKDKLINFVAGADGYDDNKNGISTEIRDWVLGDILHSKPLIFSYSSYTEAQEDLCPPIPDDGSAGRNRSMIFVGSNDGMFHAFRDCDGKEVWAFITDNVLPNLKYLRESEHYYFADGPPTAYIHDVNNNNIIETGDGDKVVLIFGQGRGGGSSTLASTGSRGAYYALDVSDPLAPILRWKVDSNTTGFAELGETLSSPGLARVKVGTVEKVVAFVGGGYDNNEDLRFGNTMLFPSATTATTNTTLPTSDSGNFTSLDSTAIPVNPRGRGIFAIEIANLEKANPGEAASATNPFLPVFTGGGSRVWSLVHTGSNGMDYSIPSDLTVLDMDGNGFQDRIYVGDTGGQLWRFDVSSIVPSEWTGNMIFKSNKAGEANTGRKIFYKPSVARVNGIPTLYFGTGDRNHPLNTDVIDRMFAVRDRGQSTNDGIGIGNLEDLTLDNLQGTNISLVDPLLAKLALATNYGWYVDLNLHVGEKVLAPTLIFSKQAFYTTYAPSAAASLNVCQVGNLGISRLYQLDYENAQSTQNFDDSNTYSENIRARGGVEGSYYGLLRSDREMAIGVGIPSGIVTLIDASGKITLMISSSNRVGTYQAPDAKMISPLYWIQY